MQVAAQKVVSIEYSLTSDTGALIERSDDGEPLVYLHGADSLVPGLERALEGKAVGDTLEVSVPPSEGYGERKDDLVRNIPLRRLPKDKAQPGAKFRAETEHGTQYITVKSIKGDYALVDANHPLAGQTLNFKVKVLDVRDATEEELEHGHVHGPDGHHGH